MKSSRLRDVLSAVPGRWRTSLVLLALIAVPALVCWQSVFTVDETEVALVRSFGRPCRPPLTQAGLSFKWPWQKVQQLDRRVRHVVFEPREKLTRDHEPVVVQPYVCWKVAPDAAERFVRSATDDAAAEVLLADLVWCVLDRELADRPLTDWLNASGDRDPAVEPPQVVIMAAVTRACQQRAYARFGLDVLDVQLLRFSRPERMKKDLARLMLAEQQRKSNQRCLAIETQRAQVSVQAGEQADRVLADAEEQARRIHLEGDRETQRIESEARRINPDLTDFLVGLDQCRLLIERGLPASPLALRGLLTQPGRSAQPMGGIASSRPSTSAVVPPPARSTATASAPLFNPLPRPVSGNSN